MDDLLLEPLEAYKSRYRDAFRQNAETYFDGLLKKSGVAEAENKKTVSAYAAKTHKIASLTGKLRKYKTLRGFLIFFSVVGVVLLIAGIVSLVQDSLISGIAMTAVGAVTPAVCIPIIMAKIRPVLKETQVERDKTQREADALLKEAWAQMEPLNALYDDDITRKLIEQTIPLLKIDENFNMRRYDYLSGKYGFSEPLDPARSTVGILTGEILGNPFVVDRELVHTMGSETYTGTLPISWTTTHTDSEGHVHVEHHSQILVATIVRPKPYYGEQTRLIYGNEAAPDLHFSRRPSHAERLSENAREKKVKSGAKKLRRKQEKAVTQGGSFTELGNSEFDVLFGATDRDNEVQFRLLFTPLAQKNLLSLMTDGADGYGDDFGMRKDGPLNMVSSEHSAAWDMDTGYRRYLSYSVELARKNFVAFNCGFFRSLYFDLAPLLSIPLYQQQKPQEYIYRENYPRNLTSYETEYAVNLLGERVFASPAAATRSILKTEFLRGEGGSDKVRVTAYSYSAHERVELVPKFGGDGNMHMVPVPWTEYIPIVNYSSASLCELRLTEREFERQMGTEQLKERLSGALDFSYGHGILCRKDGE